MTNEENRPPVAGRTYTHRTEPVQIKVKARWLYSQGQSCLCCAGRHAFSRGADIVASPVTSRTPHLNAISDHVYRAIEEFGDDADLIIEVRRA